MALNRCQFHVLRLLAGVRLESGVLRDRFREAGRARGKFFYLSAATFYVMMSSLKHRGLVRRLEVPTEHPGLAIAVTAFELTAEGYQLYRSARDKYAQGK